MTDPDPTDPAYWDSAVANYEAQAAPFTGFFAEAALAMLDLRPGQRLLDVATGTGAAALAAARKGMSVTAIDFSHGMIERVRAHGLANIVARQMDGQALDLPDAAFDAADTWTPVEAKTPYGTAKDAYNAVAFAPVTTSGLRLEVTSQPEFSSGVQEWTVRR